MAEQRFTEAPTTFQIKLFLERVCQIYIDLLEEFISDVTLLNRLTSLERAVKIHIRFQHTTVQNQNTTSFVRNELIPRGLISTCARAKLFESVSVAKDIISFLFAIDEYKYLYSRIRNQMASVLQLILLVGVRSREVVESDAGYQTNEGLLYKDTELVRSWSASYPEWSMHVKLRNQTATENTRRCVRPSIVPPSILGRDWR